MAEEKSETNEDINADLVERIRDGDPQLIDELWKNCKNIIASQVNRCLSVPFYAEKAAESGLTFDDIMQTQYFALLRAVNVYQRRGNAKFTTFLWSFMKCATKNTIKRSTRLPSISLNQAATQEEGEDRDLVDIIPDPESLKPFEELEHRDYIRQLRTDMELALPVLNEKRRIVIVSKYYLDMNRDDIAQKIGVTPEYVWELESSALAELSRQPSLRKYRPIGWKDPTELAPSTGFHWLKNIIDEV